MDYFLSLTLKRFLIKKKISIILNYISLIPSNIFTQDKFYFNKLRFLHICEKNHRRHSRLNIFLLQHYLSLNILKLPSYIFETYYFIEEIFTETNATLFF